MSESSFHTNADRLAGAMKDRRTKLGLTQKAAELRGGPSLEIIRRYELGNVPSGAQDGTLRKIDRAYSWEAGSAQGVLEGYEPTERAENTLVGPDGQDLPSVDKLIRMLGVIAILKANIRMMTDPNARAMEQMVIEIEDSFEATVQAVLNADLDQRYLPENGE